LCIGTNHGDSFGHRLCNDQAVEWVFVMKRQGRHNRRMLSVWCSFTLTPSSESPMQP